MNTKRAFVTHAYAWVYPDLACELALGEYLARRSKKKKKSRCRCTPHAPSAQRSAAPDRARSSSAASLRQAARGGAQVVTTDYYLLTGYYDIRARGDINSGAQMGDPPLSSELATTAGTERNDEVRCALLRAAACSVYDTCRTRSTSRMAGWATRESASCAPPLKAGTEVLPSWQGFPPESAGGGRCRS
jgi:hypothetical protein